MRNKLVYNWHLSRILRMLLAGFIIYEGYKSSEYLFIFMGLIFAAMALFNVGCCSLQSCETTIDSSKSANDSHIEFEEVN